MKLLGLERIDVDEAAARERADRDRVDDEHDLLLRQPHHQGRVGVVEPEIAQFERRAAELDHLLVADQLVRDDGVRVLQHLQPLGRVLVRDDARAGVLERLAARDVVEVVVAVDQVLDRLVGDLLDLVDILLPAGRAAIGDRVGRDDAVLGDDEHRLMIAIAEDVDAFGALDLGGGDLRPLRLLRGGRDGERHCDRRCGAGKNNSHGCLPLGRRANACGEPHAPCSVAARRAFKSRLLEAKRGGLPHKPLRRRGNKHGRAVLRRPRMRSRGLFAADHADDLPGAGGVLAVAELVGAERIDRLGRHEPDLAARGRRRA